jgi:hypothetical protein
VGYFELSSSFCLLFGFPKVNYVSNRSSFFCRPGDSVAGPACFLLTRLVKLDLAAAKVAGSRVEGVAV